MQADDVVAGLEHALFEDAQVEAWSVVGDQEGGHPWFVHPDAHAEAGHAWLADFEDCLPDLVAVADAYLVVGEAFDREGLAELPVGEVIASEQLFPVPVGLDLVHEDGAVIAAVRGAICLVIAVDVTSQFPTSRPSLTTQPARTPRP